MTPMEVGRPRNVDWKRAAALLYGDWGTSKAYVIGFAFLAVGFASMQTIIAVCILTGLVGLNYVIVCKHFPDGGGVYSAALSQGRALAVLGALLLVADLTVTASLSGYEALKYLWPNLGDVWVPVGTIVVVLLFGILNAYGPRHSGGLAVALAIPMVFIVVLLIALAIPHLTTSNFLPRNDSFGHAWMSFVRSILALSGVEAIASLTGVMRADPDSPPEAPTVKRESRKAIFVVAIEVVLGTALLGWATLSMPHSWGPRLHEDSSHILRLLGEYYGQITFGETGGHILAWVVGLVVGLLLLSAVNTAIAALIGMLYILARDGEMPRAFLNLNKHGVPKLPLYVATALPIVVLLFTYLNPKNALSILGDLYAIGVVGAITVNLGCCTFNKQLKLAVWERTLFAVTFFILFCVEITLAYDKHLALFFVVIVLGVGFWLRSLSHKASGLATVTISKEMAEAVSKDAIERLRPKIQEGAKILVAARGITPVLRYALDEAKLRNATLCVLYVQEIAVFMGAASSSSKRLGWQDDPQAVPIMSLVLKAGEEMGVCVQPLYAQSTDPSTTIIDLAATMGADYLMLGSTHRSALTRLLKGNVIERVAAQLPESIELIIHS